ncbi:MAG: hypothetical protein RBR70_02425 [Arcobacter sp.]|jgi:hypothetical protein|uniref:DUF6710 family protein n=1 Tax=Arcobacter sp. TaxID=1872629 RepID=UPI002A74B6A1|nr:DUF6710 family protein [Arcobacter sp.]MDY3203915.1 hypothetical protein [Arcobacter sp.]
MELKKYFYEKFKDIFINEINSEINNKQDMECKELFEEFISSFDNKYIDKNEKDLNFRKQFINKYCNYLFFNNVVNAMTYNYAVKDINTFDIEKILDFTNKEINLGQDTIYITHPWKGENLTGNTNAYRGVVHNGFVFDKRNIRGFYIEELNIAYIYNGNHSISIGSIIGDICIKTNDNNLKSCTLKKEFYNAKVLYNKIIMDNEEIEITNWKFAVLLKLIQFIK